MRLWADIDNAAGNLVTPGPITNIIRATVTRRLDAAGSFTLEVPGTDTRALDIVLSKRRANVFVKQPGHPSRQIVRGIIDRIGAKDDTGGWRRTIDGPDNLAELKYINTYRGRKYDADTINAIVDDLLGLTTGWTRSGSDTSFKSVRFDATSILGALQALVQQQGIHFRQNGFGTIEIGAFGTPNGLRIVNAATLPPDFESNDDVLLIDSLTSEDDSEALVNWLEPLGAGQGDAMLTLEKSTRTTPYTIQTTTGPDGRTIYYIADSTSVSTYGTIQKVGKFSDIAAISNSEDDQIAAANALYDIAVAWLQRYKDPYRAYSLTVRKSRTNLLPGDKIHLRYFGRIENEWGELVDFRDINEDFWILEVREGFGDGGNTVSLKIASVDRYEQDTARIVLGALEEIRINNVSVAPYFTNPLGVFSRLIAPSFPASIPLYVTDAVSRLNRCILRFSTTPFRVTATGAASGGGAAETSSGGGLHTHVMFTRISDTPYGGGLSYYQYVLANTVTPVFGLPFVSGSPPFNLESNQAMNHTHNVNIPAHTHALAYGIQSDSQTPNTISLWINGTDYTSALGGPWAVGGGATSVELEISEQINAQPTFQQVHNIELRCASGRGEVEFIIEPYFTIQSIAVF